MNHNRLEFDDHYWDKRKGCRLPHDRLLDDPVELAKLSGPCETIVPAKEVSTYAKQTSGLASYEQ